MSNGAPVGTEDIRRPRLNRQRVVDAAIGFADDVGLEALSMRNLADRLGVAPMALYKHVAGKEQLVDAMVERLIRDVPLAPSGGEDWRAAVRTQILAARRALLLHPWAPRAIQTRAGAPPVVLAYIDALIGAFRSGGFTAELAHYAMHALGSRMWGFIQEVFPSPPPPEDPEQRAAMFAQAARLYPNVLAIAAVAAHREDGRVVQGCDDQDEFEFALDLLLDGLERRRDAEWRPDAAGQPAQR